jgi:tRNA U34 5-carboxymethylaminomethyl modifying GTPase MnmE/TrmE
LDALTVFKKAAQDDLPIECLALDLETALTALDEISGRDGRLEVLDSIFDNFCIGK